MNLNKFTDNCFCLKKKNNNKLKDKYNNLVIQNVLSNNYINENKENINTNNFDLNEGNKIEIQIMGNINNKKKIIT